MQRKLFIEANSSCNQRRIEENSHCCNQTFFNSVINYLDAKKCAPCNRTAGQKRDQVSLQWRCCVCCVDPQVAVACLRVVSVFPYRLRSSLWCGYVFITTYLSRCRRLTCETHVLYCVQYTQCIETALSDDKITSIASWWTRLDFFTEYTCRNKWLHVQFVKSAALSKTMIKEHCLYRCIGCKYGIMRSLVVN